MKGKNIEKELNDLLGDYQTLASKKDDQSLFYINQMCDLMYNETKYEINNDKELEEIITHGFKDSINKVFNDMKEYFSKIIISSMNSINQIIIMSTSNKYIDTSNIKSIYLKFKEEMESNLKIKNKIEVIMSANNTALIESIHNICPDENKHKVSEIVLRYISFIKAELNKNIVDKHDLLLSKYKLVIDTILEDVEEDRNKIKQMNIRTINNVVLNYLKEREYLVINKYTADSFNYINNAFMMFETDLEKKYKIKKNGKTSNVAKDYLLSFNNTITVKIKNIFDNMNSILLLETEKANIKLKEFNDSISHIYEMPLLFDKQFSRYKKDFNVSKKDIENLSQLINGFNSDITKYLKNNISNIFRENIKIYNSVMYKTLTLKSKLNEFNTVLSTEKIKDLLLK